MSPEIPPKPGSDKDELAARDLTKEGLGEVVSSSSDSSGDAGSGLRGKLLDDLRAKQREDAENSSRLRGSLLKKIAKSTDEPSAVGEGDSSAEAPITFSEGSTAETSTEIASPEVSRLRGSLLSVTERTSEEIGKIGETGEETALEVPDTSRLRGKLLETKSEAPASAVESTAALIPETAEEKLEPFSKDWLVQQTFVQRDGKAEFVVGGFNEGRNGELITLTCPSNGATVSLNLERFLERLQTPGEAWAVKSVG